jgi:hypothetical protein
MMACLNMRHKRLPPLFVSITFDGFKSRWDDTPAMRFAQRIRYLDRGLARRSEIYQQ